jgi:cytochrome c oxidase assembly protein subunit 15
MSRLRSDLTNRVKSLSVAAAGLALIVIVVGAYVRLSDAGLGCPDWPLCYGRPLPAQIADGAAHAKAWKEMGHRYLAATLGLLIFVIAVISWKVGRSRSLAAAILALVAFQATLGMWTVTLLLKPVIVTAHLLGGMATFALLLWLSLSQFRFGPEPKSREIRFAAALALALLAIQIALGGWVSANYAALACPDLPGCRGQAFPPMDFANAFHVLRELGRTGEGGLLPLDALVAIHWTHRMFALVVAAAAGFAAFKAFQMPASRKLGIVVACLLVLQISLGIANVVFSLPLALAAAHNAGAALLLGALVVLNFFAFHGVHPRGLPPSL